MIKIKLTHGTHHDFKARKVYKSGDVFEGTEKTLKGLAGKAELYDIQANNVELEGDALEAELRRDLEELGAKVDKRWGIERLKEELEKAVNADSEA